MDPFGESDPFSDVPYEPPIILDSQPGGQYEPYKELTLEDQEELERQAKRDLENKERQRKLTAKDNKEQEQRNSRRSQARSDLEKFYADRQKQITQNKSLNLTKESEALSNKASFNDSNSWKKVASLIDFKNDSERKDQARMKSILLAKKHESK